MKTGIKLSIIVLLALSQSSYATDDKTIGQRFFQG